MPLIHLHSEVPENEQIIELSNALMRGAVVVIPTDSVYAFACLLGNKKGMEKIRKLTGKKLHQTDLSILCRDLQMVSNYALPIQNPVFRVLNKNLPGPFTFILKANNQISKLYANNKKTIGIRIPNNPIVQALLEQLNEPICCASVHSDDEILDYITIAGDIQEQYGDRVDWVIDGGTGDVAPSTVVSFLDNKASIIRQGKGELIL